MYRKQVLRITTLCIISAFVFFACAVSVTEVEKIFDAQTPQVTASTQSFWYKIGSTLPALSVTAEVTDGGDLTYQWYAYDFEKGIGQPVANADRETFTPPAITQERPGRPYRYYVEVTNTNAGATGRKQVAVSVSTDIIAYDENNAQMPRITRQPTGGDAFLSPRMAVLVSVSSDVSDGGFTTYQWYRAKGSIAENGTPIENATSNALSIRRELFPENVERAEGTYYFFVVATNTNTRVTGRRETQVISDVAVVTVTRSKNAAVPDILEQPQGMILFVNDNIGSGGILVSVKADSEDGGDLSYQWYSNTSNSSDGGALIEEATEASYRLSEINTASPGSYYYYVVVTNTNNDVTQNKVNTTTSNAARVTVQDKRVPTTPGVDVEIQFDKKYQYVRGFGGMDVAWANFPTYKMEDYENMYNPDRLGYNMLRIMVPPNYVDINRTMEELVANKISGSMDRSNYYEFVKLVNKYGGYVLASPWTPPAAWKTNNSVNGGGTLRPNNYQDFADYLRTYCQIMSDHGAPIFAVALQNEPTWVAGYDGCEYTPEENRNFFLKVGHFTKDYRGSYNPIPGYGGGKAQPFVRTMGGESHNEIAVFHEPAMKNKISRDAIDVIGAHIYGAGPRHYSLATLTNESGEGEWEPGSAGWNPGGWRPVLLNGSGTDGTDAKEIWMTEHNINGGNAAAYALDSTWEYVWKFMNDVDLVIRHNQENVFVWWSAKRFYSMIGDGSYGTTDGAILPRGYGLSHYARFAKETGMVGVKVTGYLADDITKVSPSNVNNTSYTNDDTSAKITAFVTLKDDTKNWRKDRSNITLDDIAAISMVMYTPTNTGSGGYNLGNVKVKLPNGFKIRDAVIMRSTARVKQQMETVTIDPDRNRAYISMPVSNIVSVKFIKQ